MTYAEKLKDPRWQRKKTQVWERDDYTCCACGTKSEQVHAHHTNYTGEPWDAPLKDMVTLCHKCHTHQKEFKRRFLEIASTTRPDVIERLLTLLEGASTLNRNVRPIMISADKQCYFMLMNMEYRLMAGGKKDMDKIRLFHTLICDNPKKNEKPYLPTYSVMSVVEAGNYCNEVERLISENQKQKRKRKAKP